MIEKKKTKHLPWKITKTIEFLKNSLLNSEISIVSTDTILGFLGNINLESYNKIHSLKERRVKDQPFLVLIGSKEKLKNFIDITTLTPNLSKMIDQCWPGPVTLIFKAKNDLPSFAKSKKNTIALRYPDHEGLLSLLKSFDGLFSTSANKTVEKAPENIDEINSDLIEKTDLLVYDEEMEKRTLPSTIIDCTNPQRLTVIRESLFPVKKLEEYYGEKFEK